MKTVIHYLAGIMSVCGLGFMFACLIVGAVEYLLPIAVLMTIFAAVSVVTNPDKTGGYSG